MRVVVHIDRLALRGFRHEDRRAVAEAFRRELSRQLTREGAAARLASLVSAARVDAGSASVPHEAAPRAMGEAAGHAVARSLLP